LAGQDDVTGRLHRRLLERTGLALPADLAAECELHLALWQVAQPVYRAMGAQSQVGPEAVAQSPAGLLAVAVRPHGPGLAVEITGAPAGRYRVTLHWADAEPGAQDAVPAKAAPGQDPAPTTPQPPAPVATGVVAVGPDGAGTLELTPPASGLPASIKVARLGGQHPQEEESA
jgi:hypothetical protein